MIGISCIEMDFSSFFPAQLFLELVLDPTVFDRDRLGSEEFVEKLEEKLELTDPLRLCSRNPA